MRTEKSEDKRKKAATASRSSRERSLCMKRTWRRKRHVMLRGVRRGQKLGHEVMWKNPKMPGIISRAIKHKWRTDKDFANRVINENLALGRVRPSKVQKKTLKILRKETGLELALDYPVERYRIDIACIRKRRGVEIDGVYWHKLRKRNDKRRLRILNGLGWEILRIPLNANSLSVRDIMRCRAFLKG
jgi:very-short-patch-repair endonuclease